MKKCPVKFYANCRNAQVECRSCVAGSGRQALFYNPYKDIGDHPAANWREERYKKVKILNDSKAAEKRIQNSIATGTLRSGAALGDGDHLLLGKIRQEVKQRGARKSWNVTLEEYDKGQLQGIDVYAIEIERPDNHERIVLYCCTERLFTELLAIAKQEANHV